MFDDDSGLLSATQGCGPEPEIQSCQGFESPRSQCFGITDPMGEVTLSSENGSCFAQGGGEVPIFGVPAGPCEITVLDASENFLGMLGPDDGCFINQAGELVELALDAVAPP